MEDQLSDEALRALGARRTALHSNHASQRLLSEDHELVGLCGERAFSEWSGLPMDLGDRPSGDGGVDFRHDNSTIDVKTYRKPGNLPLEVGADAADILVLTRFIEPYDAELIGWAFREQILNQPTGRLMDGGPLNHLLPADSLRAMEALHIFL